MYCSRLCLNGFKCFYFLLIQNLGQNIVLLLNFAGGEVLLYERIVPQDHPDEASDARTDNRSVKWKLASTLKGHTSAVVHISFSHDTWTMASCGKGNEWEGGSTPMG